MHFKVSWVIDIEADSAQEAARIALRIQNNPESTANVFDVMDRETGAIEYVDFGDFPRKTIKEV